MSIAFIRIKIRRTCTDPNKIGLLNYKKKIRYYGIIRSYNSHNQAKAHLTQKLHVDVLVGWLVGSLFDDAF
jgi:hypothetical protein